MSEIKHCPTCGASKCHWNKPTRKITDIARWKSFGDDPAGANPVDGYRCKHCGIAIVDYGRYEQDEDYGDVSIFEYAPKYCMQCGHLLEEEER
ncbi:MAG: hypothetical protein HGA54_00840 [Actinobacteria bacterium]|nr:hypothetical protein [Actinomycetota bacterium]